MKIIIQTLIILILLTIFYKVLLFSLKEWQDRNKKKKDGTKTH